MRPNGLFDEPGGRVDQSAARGSAEIWVISFAGGNETLTFLGLGRQNRVENTLLTPDLQARWSACLVSSEADDEPGYSTVWMRP